MTWIYLHIKLWSINTLQDTTLELGDLLEPEPVAFSFDTTGWKIIFCFVALILCYIAFLGYKGYRKKQYIRTAISQIQELKTQNTLTETDFINKVLFILKTTAMQSYGRPEIAGLHGKDWLNFLDEKVKNCNFKADETLVANAAYNAHYKNTSPFNKDTFSNKSINWIKHHAR